MADHIIVKIPDIDGETQLKGYEKWIEVDSHSHSFHNPSDPSKGSGGSTGGKVQCSEITFTKTTDKASVNLFRGVASGKVYDKIIINFMKQTGDASDAYMTITLDSAMISNYSMSAGKDNLPHESFSVAYTKIEHKYLEQDTKTGKFTKGQTVASHHTKTGETK